MKKIIAVNGSYRRNGITDQAVKAVLDAAKKNGSEVETILLTEKEIKFCTNCRLCTKEDASLKRGKCVLTDDMEGVLDKIDAADGVVLASPINFYTVTALMKQFMERLIVYAYWPWEGGAPKPRPKGKEKKAVVITSSACPAFIARILMPHATKVLKMSAGTFNAKVVKSLHFGTINKEERQKLNPSQLKMAEAAGSRL